MKKMGQFLLTVVLVCAAVMVSGCETPAPSSPDDNHFEATINGTPLAAIGDSVIYFYFQGDSSLGIYATGGSLIYMAVEISHYHGPDTYPLVGNMHGSGGGLRYHSPDSIYYIDSFHGSGNLTIETLDYTPGTIHEVKASFAGTAATDAGYTCTITSGSAYFHEP